MLMLSNSSKIPPECLGRTDIYILDLTLNKESENIGKGELGVREAWDFRYLNNPITALFPQGSSKGQIVDIAVTPGQSTFATIGEDKMVKIWYFNHIKSQFACIHAHKFQDNPQAIGIHPLAF